MMRRLSVLALSSVLLAAPAAAQEAPDSVEDGRGRLEDLRAEQAEREARQAELAEAAEEAAEEAAGLQREMVALADEVAELERRAGDAERQIAELAPQEAEAAEALQADREALMRVLAALQRAEMRRPPPLAVRPDDAAGAARAAMLLGAIAPQLESRADAVRTRIRNLASLRERLAAQQDALRTAQAELEPRREALAGRLDQRQALEAELRAGAEAEAEAAREIAEEAEGLAELIAELERRAEAERRAREEARRRAEAEDRPVPPPSAPLPEGFAQARGLLRPPAEGAISTPFGAPRGAGPSEGVVIATRGRAQVVSPFDARVEFAESFGNYGEMLILSVGDGYHIVLAGLARLYASQGQSVLAGEPLGEMADRSAPAPELYYEIRYSGAPVDPEPWMRGGARAG